MIQCDPGNYYVPLWGMRTTIKFDDGAHHFQFKKPAGHKNQSAIYIEADEPIHETNLTA